MQEPARFEDARLGTDQVAVELRGAAAWIVLNRPEVLNAITPELVEGLAAALAAAEADPRVRAIVLSGNGRAFCVGTDLGVGNAPGFDLGGYLRRLGEVLLAFERSPKPVVAAINGVAVAGGLEMLLACDLVVAVESAKIGDAHANYGLVPGGGSSVRLPQRVGAVRAKQLLFTGQALPATELAGWGLVNTVVADDALQSTVDALCAVLATRSPLGLRRMKELVASAAELGHEEALAHEVDVVVEHADSADYREGLTAFLAKRDPEFTGR